VSIFTEIFAKNEHRRLKPSYMKNSTREHLIKTIRENIPNGVNLTNYLSDTLNIGRESAYRRVRGEINFTFDEVITLSQDLSFSIDNIVGLKRDENALFNIHMLQKLDYLGIYENMILQYGKVFKEMDDQSDTNARMSINTLPYFFHIQYEALSRFRVYKWLHQNQKIDVHDKFADFTLPDKILRAHSAFYRNIQTIQTITIVIDNNVFWSAAKDIEYFYKRGLLSYNDLTTLKKELHDIVDALEQMATDGASKWGSKMYIYISAVDLEASYLHFENSSTQFAQVRIFSISAIDSYNEALCKIQKEWIESLKRYSVLISDSGEIQRFEYTDKQREYINTILKFEQPPETQSQ